MKQGPFRGAVRETAIARMLALLQGLPVWIPIIVAMASLILLLSLGKEMGQYRAQLRAGPERADVVTLQLAFSPGKAARILGDWSRREPTPPFPESAQAICGPQVTDCAVKNIHLDWEFILTYSLLGFSALVALVRVLGTPLNGSWLIVSLLPAIAGMLDAGENLLHLRLLEGHAPLSLSLVTWASVLASVKFLLLGYALMAAIAIVGFWLFGRPWIKQESEPSASRTALSEVLDKEKHYLCSRRNLVKGLSPTDDSPWIGLAMSGGGIRSATVNLGVLQTLLGSGFFARIDYLSSVSGGGYIASSLSSLLSFKTKRSATDVFDPNQYGLGGSGEEPHFNTNAHQDHPFDPSASGGCKPWLSGRMVTEHLLAYGEFLVRRRRLLSLDLLRAIGTFASGIAAIMVLFALTMLLVAAAAAALVEASGIDLSSASYRELGAYLNILWAGMGGMPGLLRISAFGALSSLAILGACGWIARPGKSPDRWFAREGDTVAEARQHRAMWIAGGTIALLGVLLLAPAVSLRSPTPGLASLLTIPAFFLGGLAMTALARVVLSVSDLNVAGLRSSPSSRSYVSGSTGLLLYLSVFGVAIALLPWIYSALQSLETVETSDIGGVGALAAAASGFLAWLRKGKAGVESQLTSAVTWLKASGAFLQKLALGVAVTAFLIVVLFLALAALVTLMALFAGTENANPQWTDYLLAGTAIAFVLLVLGLLLDFNRLSLHYFYRDRLVDAYLRTDGPVDDGRRRHLERKRDNSEMRLTQLHGVPAAGKSSGAERQSVKTTILDRMNPFAAAPEAIASSSQAVTAAPYHLVCTCLNLTSDRDMRLRSRRSDVFVFSKLYCGSEITGFVDTALYRSGQTKLARAVTISGAAADSALGHQTFFAQSFATTLFNIRLGQWLENPCYRDGRHLHRLETGVFWPKYLLKEVFGISDSSSRLIHLSDGGHTGDNLGILPLLQRRCGLVVAVDAESDPEHRFGSLMTALRYAEIDLNVKIDMDLNQLELGDDGRTSSHLAIGYIHYPENKQRSLPASRGILFYLKSSVSSQEGEPEPIRQYRKSSPKFPHETTADQFFSEAQFEAYRTLGGVLAQSLLRNYSELCEAGLDTGKLVQALWQQRAHKPKERWQLRRSARKNRDRSPKHGRTKSDEL